MPQKLKKLYTILCFTLLLWVGVFCCQNNPVKAALEVKSYPTINLTSTPATLNESSKLPDYVFYLFNAGIALGFFSIVISLAIAGAMYMMSPAYPSADLLARAKDRVSGAVTALLIFALLYLIMTTINPQLSTIKFDTMPPEAATSTNYDNRSPGAYFFTKPGCPQDDKNFSSTKISIPDLGDKRNSVNSVGVASGSNGYVVVLYEDINFRGKCQYINAGQCTNLATAFPASASVYERFSALGGGIRFFRKSFFNPQGGYYDISSGEIGSLYIQDLNKLRFKCPPGDKDCILIQDCVQYDENHECVKREPATLAGENISSIAINGNYFVMLSYAGPGQTCQSVINDSCQGFPTPDDINKMGPPQIKWEKIRNNKNVVPNCVMIVPVAQK